MWHFWSMLKVGVIGFGGGSALIPVMEKELVRPGRMSEGQFVQDTVISNLTPGALPVKLAALSGARVSGARVAVAGALAVAVPGTVGTLVLLWLFATLGEGAVQVVELASLGVSAFILYLLAHYISKVLLPHRRPHVAGMVVAVIAFLLTSAGKLVTLVGDLTGLTLGWVQGGLSALGLILLALTVISLGTLAQSMVRGFRRRREDVLGMRDSPAGSNRVPVTPAGSRVGSAAGLATALLAGSVVIGMLFFPGPTAELLGLVGLSTISSFGGGEAYVGVADGFFVSSGMIAPEVFFGQIVPIANALPGPILVKIATGIGYVQGEELAGPAGGFLLAALVLLLTVALCAVVALLLLAGYSRAGHSLLVRNIGSYILPVICGLLATTALSLVEAGMSIAEDARLPGPAAMAAMAVLAVLVLPLKKALRMPDIVIIAAYAVLTLMAAQLLLR